MLSPLSAFLLLQGIETVALRVERHVENARQVAEFLRDDPRVEWVNYAGFPDSPYHALAQKYLGGRACSLLTFGVNGGLDAGKEFYDALKLFKRLVNIGDAKSLACHPASTTHRQMTAEEQRQGRRTPGDDPPQHRHRAHRRHLADLDQALAAAQTRRGTAHRGRIGRERMAKLSPLASTQLRPTRPRRPSAGRPPNCIDIGLVNNMPDAALEATERQFIELAAAATGRIVGAPAALLAAGIPRSERGAHLCAADYARHGRLGQARSTG